jgi:hypothetical protein
LQWFSDGLRRRITKEFVSTLIGGGQYALGICSKNGLGANEATILMTSFGAERLKVETGSVHT